jgi:hypothetical protein
MECHQLGDLRLTGRTGARAAGSGGRRSLTSTTTEGLAEIARVSPLSSGLYSMSMTGEARPAGRDKPADRVELRASHSDRERVVETLRVAAGDGRLTSDELDERVEAALTARTYGELAGLTADLPTAPGILARSGVPDPKDLLRIARRGTSARKTGRWVVPRRIEILLIGGNVRLDFTRAVLTSPLLEIRARVRGGNLSIITRPGVVVDASQVELTDGDMVICEPQVQPSAAILTIEVTGVIQGGNLWARQPRRTLWQ